jgi:hypothetical protein
MPAVAEELSAVREMVQDIGEALKDRDGHGAGTHLHYISDWLERISSRG